MTDMFSFAIELLILARVSMHRIQRFLLLEESSVPAIEHFDHEINDKEDYELNIMSVTNPHIVLRGVKSCWENENDFRLKDINLDFRNPSLTAVIGTVGSGKTSLLNVILKEKECSGKLDVRGKVSYASQEPWLFNQSLRKNIILADKFDNERYFKVLEICALLEDCKNLPDSDMTWVGERGSSLSGGQRMRVNLARSLYRKADIYLLDDPLSALDTHVANHVFRGIREFLKKKICVLVTHQHQFASEVDHVVILESGSIIRQGSYENVKDDIKNCFETSQKSENVNSQTDRNSASEKKSITSASKESRRKGKVSWDVYKEYLNVFGHPCIVFLIVMLFILSQFSASSSDYLIGYW